MSDMYQAKSYRNETDARRKRLMTLPDQPRRMAADALAVLQTEPPGSTYHKMAVALLKVLYRKYCRNQTNVERVA